MNDEQLESCLKILKSSSREPDLIDESIEEKMMNELALLKSNRSRMKRIALVFGILLVCGTGFVAAGGDVTVKNYIVSNSEVDADGNPVHESESLWFYLIRHVHEHLGGHGSMHHGAEHLDGSK